jgi:homocitrate synthase
MCLGVDGVDVVIGTSSFLRQYSHGKVRLPCSSAASIFESAESRVFLQDMTYILKSAIEVIEFVKSKNIEIRFSFVYSTKRLAEGQKIDIDTVPDVAPRILSDQTSSTCSPSTEQSTRLALTGLVSLIRSAARIPARSMTSCAPCAVSSPVTLRHTSTTTLAAVCAVFSFSLCHICSSKHLHVTTAIANAFCALEAGATHIDTSVLGIGERNGITPLGGLIARMMIVDPEYVKGKYNLHALRELENIVAEACEIQVPFNNYITGFCAFTHKAGIHAKAILANPSTYEALNPQDFGMSRYIHVGSRVTGWHAVSFIVVLFP